MIERVGPYEIRSLLGRGGMGEVYRGHDARLGRDVAIKILPTVFMSDPERVLRFEREARVLASLNHPHIGAIYGLEDAVGANGVVSRALVLELVEGETLEEFIARNASPSGGVALATAVDLARQIADGLDGAHERGIVHRDLKPANIKVTPNGAVKILDFGLAKVNDLDTATAGQDATGVTHHGSVVGTPAYMSPEQARGLPTDKRTDIWAFGCVLFELLSGRRAFAGPSVTDVFSAVLTQEPDWTVLPESAAPGLCQLVRRCLAKNTRDRLRDIGDASFDAGQAARGDDTRVRSARARDVQFRRLADFDGLKEWPAISPDGKMVVFAALVGKHRHLWLQRLAGGAPLQITHDDLDHQHPRWAPDSDAIIYYTPPAVAGEEGMLYEMSTLGGAARPIVGSAGAADISHSGERLAFFVHISGKNALVTTSRDGLDLKQIAEGEPWHVGPPRWSPDDRHLVYAASVLARFDERLSVVPSDGGTPRPIARAGSIRGLCWLPDGRGVIYSCSAGSTVPYPPTLNLRRVGLDGSGEAQVTFGDDSYVDPDVHSSGKLLACRIRAQSDIWSFPADGSAQANMQGAVRVTRQTGQVQTPSVSPDGREVAFLSDSGGHGNLWIARVDGGSIRQLTFERDPGVAIGVPNWSPRGDRIAFVANRGHAALSIVSPDGRAARPLVDNGFAAAWSRDGEWLYFVTQAESPTWHIEKIRVSTGERVVVRDDGNSHAPIEGDGTFFFARQPHRGNIWDWEICRTPLAGGAEQVIARIPPERIPVSSQFVQGALSPDGRWIALPCIDGATTNIWLLPTDGSPLRQATDFGDRATVIARQVSWSPDGRIYAAVAETKTDLVLFDGLLES